MKSESQTRLLAILLALVTLGAFVLAVANLSQESSQSAPTDGAHLTEVRGGLKAYIVAKGTPAYRAGIRAGDVVTAINGVLVSSVATAERQIAAAGVWSKATYSIQRMGDAGKMVTLQINVILEPTDQTDNVVLRLIALVYLAIGLYVLLRRWTAPKSTHFYVFCLVSFVLCAFKYTGVFDGLDQTVLWCNVAAMALQPALFLHFALSFHGETEKLRAWRYIYPLLYVPGACLMFLRYRALEVWSPTGKLIHRLDQTDYAYLATYYVIAALVFYVRYRTEQQPLQRQQLKWLSRGTMVTVTPFTLLYVIPFLLDWSMPSVVTRVALLSLILLPLTFSWAIVRYRLMDVDLIFKRGVTYTLATAALVGLYFGVIALAASFVRGRFQNFGFWGLAAAVVTTGILFDPLKRAIQGRVDRLFEQKQVDYRETLVKFGRELNAQTDLQTLVGLIVERLPETLLLNRVGVFLADDEVTRADSHFRLIGSHGLSVNAKSESATYDLGFFDFDTRGDNHIFFESPQNAIRLPESQRHTAAALDLNYYVPCRVARGEGGGLHTIAVLGLGRTGDGDFLSSEDVELLESLAGYIGIAIQNAQLYRRLEQKILDFERLRDFSENIVESINIGVFAVDLNDRIESWNAQMEVMYATPRADALRKPMDEVFPAEFMQEFDRLRSEAGLCTLYKFRLATPAGEARTANITIAPLLNKEFHAVGRIIIVDDITETVNMEKQLTQSEKLSSIGLLAAGVAHEVNTPLAVISSYTQMLGKQLRADEATNARLQPVLEKITQQTFRASEIVNGLLNFARMGSVDFARVDANTVMRDTALLLEHSLRSSRVSVEMKLAPALPPISGNLGKLQQVAVNLIMNAKDALQDQATGGKIIISTERTERGVEVHVEDNGPGMPPEVLAKIYDPFFTTKSNPKEGQRKGTGLGLAVTYGIVQEHGGTINVMSTLGRGTTFTLTFPALESEQVREARSASPGQSSTDEGKVVHV